MTRINGRDREIERYRDEDGEMERWIFIEIERRRL